MSEFEAFAAEVVALVKSVKDHCDTEVARCKADAAITIAELRAQMAAIPAGKDGRDGDHGLKGDAGKDGSAGVDGKSVDVATLEPIIARLVKTAADAIQPPRDGKDGKDGRDGASVTLDAVQALVRAEVSGAVAALPKPERGEPGRDGINGKDGANGRDGSNGADGLNGKDGAQAVIDVEEVVQALKRDVEAVAMLRGERGDRGEKGVDGQDGRPGTDGRNGDPGKDGQRGEDGTNGDHGTNGLDAPPVTPEQLREAVDLRFASWALDFERIATDRQRNAIDSIPLPRDGRDGKDGKAGVGMEDFTLDVGLIDDRNLRFELAAGGRTAAHAVKLPIQIYRQQWRHEAGYEVGDTVTFGGSLWSCIKDTKAKPGESPDWRLAVRRGNDGKDATA